MVVEAGERVSGAAPFRTLVNVVTALGPALASHPWTCAMASAASPTPVAAIEPIGTGPSANVSYASEYNPLTG